ncbi:MAG: hypothetical protein RMJ88_08990 [Thermogemmata sp.]|nr:hypothetical protein [Thermogemmata sp.]
MSGILSLLRLAIAGTSLLALGLTGCDRHNPSSPSSGSPLRYAEIRVVDADTGRGIPLVELETVHHVRFVTDNAGRVAVGEPELLDRDVFFHVRSHGYEYPADGFGFRGVRLKLQRGQAAVIRLPRRQIAERLCRLTGEGLYRDSLLLGYSPAGGAVQGQVAGQDSVQAVLYRQRIYWFWGDTNRLLYPLGLFRPLNYRVSRKNRFFSCQAMHHPTGG